MGTRAHKSGSHQLHNCRGIERFAVCRKNATIRARVTSHVLYSRTRREQRSAIRIARRNVVSPLETRRSRTRSRDTSSFSLLSEIRGAAGRVASRRGRNALPNRVAENRRRRRERITGARARIRTRERRERERENIAPRVIVVVPGRATTLPRTRSRPRNGETSCAYLLTKTLSSFERVSRLRPKPPSVNRTDTYVPAGGERAQPRRAAVRLAVALDTVKLVPAETANNRADLAGLGRYAFTRRRDKFLGFSSLSLSLSPVFSPASESESTRRRRLRIRAYRPDRLFLDGAHSLSRLSARNVFAEKGPSRRALRRRAATRTGL